MYFIVMAQVALNGNDFSTKTYKAFKKGSVISWQFKSL